MKFLHLAVVFVTTFLSEASALELTIELTGLESRDGNILYAVYTDETSFLSGADNAFASGFLLLSDTNGVPEITLSLEEGQYAVSVIHDENGNGELDIGAFGIPTEGYGFSQNPKTNLAPPIFSETRLELKRTDKTIEIRIKY
ncbi:DUF2141 domain-containing protein [Phaeobacter sp.]|uniref:DUF2141 domain-containing protein n=1 Tax=Phaeobacter sp. TaxID=1902409 RepID=UPI0025E1F802|nr:DUF2141 domain-containing protein [Phaeobacter sp.]